MLGATQMGAAILDCSAGRSWRNGRNRQTMREKGQTLCANDVVDAGDASKSRRGEMQVEFGRRTRNKKVNKKETKKRIKREKKGE